VAIKILVDDRRQDHESRSRFLRERRACARMDHPQVVRVLDAGEDGSILYLVMELLDGLTLQEVAARLGPLPVADAIAVAIQALAGLSHAHSRGLVHRDVKPSNLMLSPGGVVTIVDWGLSRFTDGVEEAESRFVTRGLVAFGTPQFMAPERTIYPESCDLRSDIFSLGATLNAMLIGRTASGSNGPSPSDGTRPPAAKTLPSLRDIRPDVPAALARVIQRMVDPDIEARPASFEDATALLEPFARDANLAGLLDVAGQTAPRRIVVPNVVTPTPGPSTGSQRMQVRPRLRMKDAAPWATAFLAIAVSFVGWRVLPRWIPGSSLRTSQISASASSSTRTAAPESVSPRLDVRLVGKSRRIFRPGEPMRFEVTSATAGTLLAYKIPVIDARPGVPRPVALENHSHSRQIAAGQAIEFITKSGENLSEGARGRGVIVLALSPQNTRAEDAEAAGRTALNGLSNDGPEALETLKSSAWPAGWTCRLVRYDVIGDPIE
jgi:serine/threonine protein kinase